MICPIYQVHDVHVVAYTRRNYIDRFQIQIIESAAFSLNPWKSKHLLRQTWHL